jgi:hypothetical protein
VGYPLPLTYQWLRNDTLLPGEQGKTLRIEGAQLRHLGTYKCEVRNAADDVTTTSTVTLDFLPMAPVVVSHPASRDVTEGEKVVLQTKGAWGLWGWWGGGSTRSWHTPCPYPQQPTTSSTSTTSPSSPHSLKSCLLPSSEAWPVVIPWG